ncbi:toxin-antitoxin system YwqK family antitoxin [Dyella humi]|uniref:Lipoprotein n=1 Tax=Dyella humi TaxID=1770547 RepID=A0ABW8IM53_9GAMM
MKRNAQVWMLLALTPLAISLAGCGSNAVDSRDIEFNDGLAFQVNHQDPFTGVVTFVHDTPGIVGKLYGYAPMSGYTAAENNNVQRNFTCSFHYVKGAMNGDAECKDDSGDKMASFSVNEKSLFDGSAVIYSPLDATKKYAELNWKSGTLDGDQKTYGDDGSTVIDEIHLSDGHKDGREVVKDESGNVIADGKWDNGNPESGDFAKWKIGAEPNGVKIITVESVISYANGQKSGKAIFYAEDDSTSPPSTSISSGEYDNGNRSGVWKDGHVGGIVNAITSSFQGGLPQVLYNFPPYKMTNGDTKSVFKDCHSYESHWSQGHIAGKVECFATSGSPVVEFEIENGQLVGDVLFHDPSSGQIVTIHQQDGREVSESGAESTSQAAPQTAPRSAPGSDGCVNKWIDAFHKEQGEDASISNDQLSEWQDDCQQGKQAAL